MFLDASAIVSIIAREADAEALAARLAEASDLYTSPIAVYEAVLGLARTGSMSINDAYSMLDDFLEQVRAVIMPINAEIGRAAVAAFERYGKGRHQAALNMGDCFAYACARELDVPLLYMGNDFPQTDIAAA
jgi:ribonuclease VapC